MEIGQQEKSHGRPRSRKQGSLWPNGARSAGLHSGNQIRTDIRRILTAYFERVVLMPELTAQHAAEIAQALESGLGNTAASQRSFQPERAREAFEAAIRLIVREAA